MRITPSNTEHPDDEQDLEWVRVVVWMTASAIPSTVNDSV